MFDIFKLSTGPKQSKIPQQKRKTAIPSNNGAGERVQKSRSTCASGPNELFELWQGGQALGNYWLGFILLGWEVMTNGRYS